jgi:hypothetical protein
MSKKAPDIEWAVYILGAKARHVGRVFAEDAKSAMAKAIRSVADTEATTRENVDAEGLGTQRSEAHNRISIASAARKPKMYICGLTLL